MPPKANGPIPAQDNSIPEPDNPAEPSVFSRPAAMPQPEPLAGPAEPPIAPATETGPDLTNNPTTPSPATGLPTNITIPQQTTVPPRGPTPEPPLVTSPVQPIFSTGNIPGQKPKLSKRNKLKKLLPFALIAVVLIAAATAAFVFLGQGRSAEATASRYWEALLSADYEAYKEVSEEDSLPGNEEEFQAGAKGIKNALVGDVEHVSTNESSKDGKDRAVSIYKLRIKFAGQEDVQYTALLLEKRDGNWKVVNIGGNSGTEPPSNPDDYPDRAFGSASGSEDDDGDSQETANRTLDTQKRTDINAIVTQLEVYYNDFGSYPSLEQLNNILFVSENLQGLNPTALYPGETLVPISSTPSADSYAYMPDAEGQACDNQTVDCTSFTMVAVLSDGSEYQKVSLNE